ncbi:hypothetical protein EON79_02005 [bacterium]|nr:MAG: hypothetical protein EON79_02005 [bacterium]
MAVRDTEFGSFLPQRSITREDALREQRRIVFLSAGALLFFVFVFLLPAFLRSSPDRWFGLIYYPIVGLLCVGPLRQAYVQHGRMAEGGERGFLVGSKGFGEVLLGGGEYIPVSGSWTPWSKFARVEEGASGRILLQDWSHVEVPVELIPALLAAAQARSQPLPTAKEPASLPPGPKDQGS